MSRVDGAVIGAARRIPGIRTVLVRGVSTLLLAAACRQSDVRPRAVPGGDAERGRELIATYGCGACHVVPGVPGAVGQVGPPLRDIGARSYLAGRLPNEPANLVRWIRAPQSVDSGTVMPDLGVSEPAASDIAAFLYTLQPGGLGPPHLLPTDLIPAH